jgi:RNA recognition motif-containing protein
LGAVNARPLCFKKAPDLLLMNIYVGNLPYSTTDADLEAMFQQFGSVQSAKVIFDRETQRSKGFGFVEMASSDDGNKAIEALNGNEVGGRQLRVNEARPRTDNFRGPR